MGMEYMSPILNSIFRCLITYPLLLFAARMIGRKTLSNMTFFDFVVGITIGSATANISLGPDSTLKKGITVLLTFAVLTILIDYFHIKSIWFRKLVNSEPVVIIDNGKIQDQNLKRLRLALGDLLSLLRKNKVFNISDVEYALIENTGEISILLKTQKQPVTPSNLKIPTSYQGLTKDLIIDGSILHKNLHAVQLDEVWLQNQLEQQGIKSASSVFFAAIDSAGKLYVSLKSNELVSQDQFGIE